MSGLFYLSIILLQLCNGYVILDSGCTDPTKIYYIANPTNCSEYFECVRGTKFKESCPSGLVWDQINNICDYNDYVGCIPTTTPATSPSPDPICPPTGSIDVFYPYDCTKYYRCVDGQKTIKKCPENLYFDPVTSTCTYTDLVNCTVTPSSTPDTTSSTPSTPSTTTSTTISTTTGSSVTNDPLCPSTETMDVFYPYDCNKYYHCVNGQKTLKTCPENLYFNPVTAECDYMDLVDCKISTTSPITKSTPSKPTPSDKTTSSSTTTTTTTTEKPGDICEGKPDGTYLPDPTSCRRFYDCSNGIANLLACPTGTIWDESIIACVNSDSDCT